MKFKLVSILVLSWVKIVILEEANNHEFNIVSTSQRPPQIETTDERLAKIVENLNIYTKLDKNSRRLEILELQNQQMQRALENALTNLTDLYTKVSALNHKLVEVDFHSKQIEQKLENTSLTLTTCLKKHTDISEMDHRLEAVELQNKQIQTKLENIDKDLIKFTRNSTETFPKNCKEVKKRGGNISQIYRIQPDLSSESFLVLCNMDIREGGWTYLLNRFDGSQDFFLNWNDYKNGFGNLSGEFWLGLQHIHQLTGDKDKELLIEVVDNEQKKVYAHYISFSIDNESKDYKLRTLNGYSGDAGDSFSDLVGMKFSTKDKEHSGGCATGYTGAWWYKSCFYCHLTGRYLKGNLPKKNYGQGIHWWTFHGIEYGLKEARMMIK